MIKVGFLYYLNRTTLHFLLFFQPNITVVFRIDRYIINFNYACIHYPLSTYIACLSLFVIFPSFTSLLFLPLLGLSHLNTIFYPSSSASALLFYNSSSQLIRLELVPNNTSTLCSISLGSILFIDNSILRYTPYSLPFSSAGILIFNHITVTPHCLTKFSSLVDSSYEPPAIHSHINPHLSAIHLVDSSLEDIRIEKGDQTLLNSHAVFSQSIMRCTFRNLTVDDRSSSRPDYAESWDCSLTSTSINSCEDSIYGSIVTGTSTQTLHAFHCTNTTFTACQRTHDPPRLTDIRRRRLWKTLSDSSADSSDCKSSTASPPLSEMYELLNITSYTTRCTFAGVSHSFEMCLFNGCIAATEGADGGAVYCTGTEESPLSSFKFKHSILLNCSASRYGGGLYIAYATTFTADGLGVILCRATKGAGVYVANVANYVPNTTIFSNCLFSKNSASVDGHDLYIYSNISSPYNPISNSYTFTNQAARVSYSNSSSNYSSADNWLPYHDPIFYSNESSDYTEPDFFCLTTTPYCKTLVDPWVRGLITTSTYTINLYPGTYDVAVPVPILDMNITACGVSDDVSEYPIVNITDASSGMIQVTSGSTFLKQINLTVSTALTNNPLLIIYTSGICTLNSVFILSDPNITHSLSLFQTVLGGTFAWTNVTISSFMIEQSPLLMTGYTTSLNLSNVNFENITRNAGHGAVLGLTSSTAQITLSNVSFINCNCLTGGGGAVMANLTGISIFTFTNLNFTNCNASSSGGAIYFAHSASTILQLKNLSITNCTSARYGGGAYITAESDMNQLRLSNLTFSGCRDRRTNASAEDVNANGNGIVLYSPTLSAFDTLTGWDDFIPLTEYDSSLELVYSGAYNATSTIPEGTFFTLLHFLFPPTAPNSTTIYVSPSGFDRSTCGWLDLPCFSLKQPICDTNNTITSITLTPGNHHREFSTITISTGKLLNSSPYNHST